MSIVFFLVGAGVVTLDQLTKRAIATHFLPDESRTVIPHVLWLTYVQNTHGAFGFFGTHPLLLALAALAVVLMFYYWYRQDSATLLTHIAFGMIIGGAIGNIIDRLRFHYVIDFIDLRWWPVFNAADSAISIGVGLLLLRIILYERKPSVRASATEPPAALPEPPSERSPAEP